MHGARLARVDIRPTCTCKFVINIVISWFPLSPLNHFVHPQSNMKIRCKKNQASIQSQRAQLDAARKRLTAERNVS